MNTLCTYVIAIFLAQMKDPTRIAMDDGASNAMGDGVGVIITSLEGFHIPFTSRIDFDYQ